jgi:hypothetical protein
MLDCGLRINRQDAKNAKRLSNHPLFIISYGLLPEFFLATLASWRLICNPTLLVLLLFENGGFFYLITSAF